MRWCHKFNVFLHYMIFISQYFKLAEPRFNSSWFNGGLVDGFKWLIHFFSKLINHACISCIILTVLSFMYIYTVYTFNGLAMMLRFIIFTTRRNIYMLYWMHLRYVDLYFLFSWRNIHYSQFACFSKTFWCVIRL